MTDLAFFLHLQQEVCEFFILQVLVDVQLAHIVIEVEIKVISLAFLQLLVEDLLVLAEIGQVIARELSCQIEAAAVVLLESFAYDSLTVSVMVSPCSVEIVDAVGHSVVDHLLHGGRIRSAVISVDARQTHRCTADACSPVPGRKASDL